MSRRYTTDREIEAALAESARTFFVCQRDYLVRGAEWHWSDLDFRHDGYPTVEAARARIAGLKPDRFQRAFRILKVTTARIEEVVTDT